VEYELTEFGKTLCTAMMTLVDWAMKFPRTREMFDEESKIALTALKSDQHNQNLDTIVAPQSEAGSSPRKKGEESTFLPFGLRSEQGM
jgi:hypothetical protein